MKRLPHIKEAITRLAPAGDVWILTGKSAYPRVKLHLETPVVLEPERRKAVVWLPADESPLLFEYPFAGLFPIVEIWGDYEHRIELSEALDGAGVHNAWFHTMGTVDATIDSYNEMIGKWIVEQVAMPVITAKSLLREIINNEYE